MKILKEGTPAKAVISCSHCKCEMEYTNKDMQKDYESAYSQVTSLVRKELYVICPCCGEHITVQKL